MPEQDNTVEKLLGGQTPEQFFDEEFREHMVAKVRGSLPQEKADMRAEGVRIAQDLAREGSVTSNVTGQKMGSIPARVYHRWNQEYPGCWRDSEFKEAFFTDNPQYRSRGWKPRQFGTRRGVTYSMGVPISPHKAMHLL